MAFRKIELTDKQKSEYVKQYMAARKEAKSSGAVAKVAEAAGVHAMTLRNWAIAEGKLPAPEKRSAAKSPAKSGKGKK